MSRNINGLEIDLGEEKILLSVPQTDIKSDKIIISQIIDDYINKRVTARTRSVLGSVVLWEGEDYDLIGQWTDEDVQHRILELINSKNSQEN